MTILGLLTPVSGEQFEQIRVIKESSRGTVALVRRTSDGREFFLRRFDGDGSAYRKLRTLRSPHLPQVYHVSEEDGAIVVLEEYIVGQPLTDLLHRHRLSRPKARRLILQLCRALDTLHAAGIVHRDIKPDNIILRDGIAVLVDFDAARLYEPGTATDTQVLGTVGYAAPEQFGISQSDKRTDLYTVGVLLNVALTGQHPSVGRLAPGSMGRVIRRCTMVNPDDRYQSANHLRRALRLQPWMPWLKGAAAAAVVALLAVGIPRWFPAPPAAEGDFSAPSALPSPLPTATSEPTPPPTATPLPTPSPTPEPDPTPTPEPDPTPTPEPDPTPTPEADPAPTPVPSYTVPQPSPPPNPAVDLSLSAVANAVYPYFHTEYGVSGYKCYGVEIHGVQGQLMEGEIVRLTLLFAAEMEFRFTVSVSGSSDTVWNSGAVYGYDALTAYPGDTQFSVDIPLSQLIGQKTVTMSLHNRVPSPDGIHSDIENRAAAVIGVPLLLDALAVETPGLLPDPGEARTPLTDPLILDCGLRYIGTDGLPTTGFTVNSLSGQLFSDNTVTFVLTFAAEEAFKLTVFDPPNGQPFALTSVSPGDTEWTFTVSVSAIANVDQLTVKFYSSRNYSNCGFVHIYGDLLRQFLFI